MKPVAAGFLYVLPYRTAGTERDATTRLTDAVAAHIEGTLIQTPAFFDDIRLPGEVEVVDKLDAARVEAMRLEEQLEIFVRHKQLLGHLQGEPLEAVVRAELTFVLEGSALAAKDLGERFVEDFVVVDESGAHVAIAESKAAAGGVSLTHVNQINSHRTEFLDVGGDDLPGLLVVNTFRNDDSLDNRRGEPVVDRVVRHARRLNVLVLRTWDLYSLVARKLAGKDDSSELVDALVNGGGWLEVNDEISLHTGA